MQPCRPGCPTGALPTARNEGHRPQAVQPRVADHPRPEASRTPQRRAPPEGGATAILVRASSIFRVPQRRAPPEGGATGASTNIGAGYYSCPQRRAPPEGGATQIAANGIVTLGLSLNEGHRPKAVQQRLLRSTGLTPTWDPQRRAPPDGGATPRRLGHPRRRRSSLNEGHRPKAVQLSPTCRAAELAAPLNEGHRPKAVQLREAYAQTLRRNWPSTKGTARRRCNDAASPAAFFWLLSPQRRAPPEGGATFDSGNLSGGVCLPQRRAPPEGGATRRALVAVRV